MIKKQKLNNPTNILRSLRFSLFVFFQFLKFLNLFLTFRKLGIKVRIANPLWSLAISHFILICWKNASERKLNSIFMTTKNQNIKKNWIKNAFCILIPNQFLFLMIYKGSQGSSLIFFLVFNGHKNSWNIWNQSMKGKFFKLEKKDKCVMFKSLK